MKPLNVLAVASEIYPLVKTGGLADVVGALPAALAKEGIATRTLIPGYPSAIAAMRGAEIVYRYDGLQGGPAQLLAANAAGLDLLVLDAPHLFSRPGNPYLGPDGREWPDNAQRFAALAQCAALIARGGAEAVPGRAGNKTAASARGPTALSALRPDVVHLHDWQAGLVAALLHYGAGPRPATVITVHNLAFPGRAPRELLGAIGLPPHAYAIDGVEFHGAISYLKAGLAFADRITTVSPTYANEIQNVDGGMGFDGLLRLRASVLTGILNGIDESVWNPASDPHLVAQYDARNLARRAKNKAALQQRLGLAVEPASVVFGVVSRMTHQKGIDLLLSALPMLAASGVQLAVLGSGDAPFEQGFTSAAKAHAGRVAATIGYDEGLAHLIQGGADALLVPSRFEPCGLTQLCALRYGAVPVVARVGGLADTIIDANEMALAAGVATGLQFAPVTTPQLERAIARALALRHEPHVWRRLQSRAMATDVGWGRPAKRYAQILREAAAQRESSGTLRSGLSVGLGVGSDTARAAGSSA